MERRYGPEAVADHFRSFDTICSATQERQDAVVALIEEPLDVMVVVGGYNSSNTCHLAALVQSKGVRTFHIEDAEGVDPAAGTIRHQPIGAKHEATTAAWLGDSRVIGITAGASTPNNKVGETIARICTLAGVAEELRAQTG
jgi:4-hydroxy-3-methylbut-2-enyl diphosphate reductase